MDIEGLFNCGQPVKQVEEVMTICLGINFFFLWMYLFCFGWPSTLYSPFQYAFLGLWCTQIFQGGGLVATRLMGLSWHF